MKTKLTFGEVLLRLFFAFYFLFSPIAPTVTALAASMAQTQDKRVEDGLLTPLTKLPAEKLITFDPPYPEPDFDTLRTSPEPDTIDKTLPPEKIKSDIEFSLIPTSNTVTEDEPLALTVVISNNSTTDLVNLSFMDELEEGFSYIDSDHSDLIYESSTKTVSIDLGTLPAGELVSFEYTISIDAGTNGKNLGKVWVHTAELI